MTITIRQAEQRDAEGLTALMHASAAYRDGYATILRGYAVTLAQIENDRVYLAEGDARLAGFYSLIVTGEAELDLMFVADAMQGRGIGRLLFAHMIEQARGYAIANVRIVAHPPALRFYQAMGARQVGIKPPTPAASWERPILELTIGDI